MSNASRPTQLIVNTKNIAHNIKELQNFVGKDVKIMPVIKARGYGTEIDTQISLFKALGIDTLAVAVVDEGVFLRKIGFKGTIFLLNQLLECEIEKALKYNLTLSVCLIDFIKLVNKCAFNSKKVASIHLEVDTGMNRTGIAANDIYKFLNAIQNSKNIKLEGLFTHFSSSDSDIRYTKSQIKKFDTLVEITKNQFNLKYVHCCNTAGILNFREAHYNLVRPGISIYGYLPSPNLQQKINLIPATTLKSKITFIHNVPAGGSISYNRSYIAKRNSTIATVPIGFADGLPRMYKGKVFVNGSFANIVGLINMDSLMIDVTAINNIKIGTDVYIWDNKNILLEKIAQDCKTINYEILSNLSPRIVKVFI